MDENAELKALEQIVDALETVLDEPVSSITRDAAIQRFKCSYVLSQAIIRQRLRLIGIPNIAVAPSHNLFREATLAGLIKDSHRWVEYCRVRITSPQGYDDSVADKIYRTASDFLPDVKALIAVVKLAA